MADDRFWRTLDDLAISADLRIDRPKGSSHPRFPAYVYPVDYGYLDGTQGGDGEGIDVWRGSLATTTVVGVVSAVDPIKRNAELKLIVGCSPEEISQIEAFYQPQPQAALIQLRPH